MKTNLILLIAALGLAGASVRAGILISGIVDGTESGGIPKGLEIVATSDILDLSIYQIARDTNGAGPWDTFFVLPSIALNAGDFFYVAGNTDSETIMNNLGFTVGLVTGTLGVNGDDIIGLATGGAPADVFDSVGVVGQGDTNFYENSFAVRLGGSTTPSLINTDGSNFTITGYSEDGFSGTSGFGTYVIPEPSSIILMSLVGLATVVTLRNRKKK